MTTRTTAEIARDLASLWQILSEPTTQARTDLAIVEALLDRPIPELGAALGVALDALDRREADDAKVRAILEALVALLIPKDWTAHEGDACPVDPEAVVMADLGDGAELVDRAVLLAWSAGRWASRCGPSASVPRAPPVCLKPSTRSGICPATITMTRFSAMTRIPLRSFICLFPTNFKTTLPI